MADVPSATQLNQFLVASKCFLNVADDNSAGDTYTELQSWGLRGSHNEAVSSYTLREQYDYARGGMEFDFTMAATTAAINHLLTRYSFGSGSTGSLTVYHWRVEYYTVGGGTTPQYLNFTGRLKAFNVNRAGGGSGAVTASGTIRLQDDNGLGIVPTSETTRR